MALLPKLFQPLFTQPSVVATQKLNVMSQALLFPGLVVLRHPLERRDFYIDSIITSPSMGELISVGTINFLG